MSIHVRPWDGKKEISLLYGSGIIAKALDGLIRVALCLFDLPQLEKLLQPHPESTPGVNPAA
jgi:hypothetical protein